MDLPFRNALAQMPPIPGTRVLTPLRVVVVCLVIGLTSWLTYAMVIINSEGLLVSPGGPPIGGDFVAFWSAARAVIAGHAAAIYEPAFFQDWMLATAMERDSFNLTWQYPPTYYFYILPLAFVPYLLGLALWSGTTGALYCLATQRLFNLQRTGVLLLLATPVVFNAAITGQNGFLTAALLFLAAALPDRRPLLAGFAAGLLTVKPQLGVLLPIAYIAGGHWRAFFTAAATALTLAAASFAVFGPELWQAFFDSIFRVSEGVQNSVFPIHKMPTIFASLAGLGVPSNIAMALQGLTALGVMAGVFFFWRRVKAWDLRAGVLCAGVFLCTPYAYIYEMTILILPVLVVIRRAIKDGWRVGDEYLIAAIWIASFFLPGFAEVARAQLGFAMVLATLFLVVRRADQFSFFASSRAIASDRLKTS